MGDSVVVGLLALVLLAILRQEIAFNISMRWIDVVCAVLNRRITAGCYLHESEDWLWKADLSLISILPFEHLIWRLDVWTLRQVADKDERVATMLAEYEGANAR